MLDLRPWGRPLACNLQPNAIRTSRMLLVALDFSVRTCNQALFYTNADGGVEQFGVCCQQKTVTQARQGFSLVRGAKQHRGMRAVLALVCLFLHCRQPFRDFECVLRLAGTAGIGCVTVGAEVVGLSGV